MVLPSPFQILAAERAGYGGVPAAEALLAIQQILRALQRWQPRPPYHPFDFAAPGSGRGHTGWPTVAAGGETERLALYMQRLATSAAFARFARQQLGFRRPDRPLTLPFHRPRTVLPNWLGHLHGVRLKTSPNRYHPEAVWLHGGVWHFDARTCRLGFSISYAYRHESASWCIGLAARPGETLGAFLPRLWRWLEPQIQWRHPEAWYGQFCTGPDGMKQNELRTCAGPEQALERYKQRLRQVFAWGAGAPGFWENEVAEALLRDADPQYRTMGTIQMTGARLRTLHRWIREDRPAS